MITVRCACGACDEWALIELQGEIERTDGDELLDGLDVGTLCKSSAGVLTLTVGYHQVEGKLTTLKTPLAILSRVGAHADAGEGECAGEVAYEVVGVVRHKYHFKTRPKALISKPDPGKRLKQAHSEAGKTFFASKAAAAKPLASPPPPEAAGGSGDAS